MLKMAWKTITTLRWAFRLVYCSMSRFLWRNSWLKYLFSFDEETRVEKTLASQFSWNSCPCLTRTWALRKLIETITCQLSSTLMQLLFSFGKDMRVEKTLIQTLACQLPSSFIQLLFSFDQIEKILIQTLAYTCLALWKHHVNLLLQSFRSVSSDLHQC